MPRLPVPNADADQWGTLLNEFLLVAHRADGTLKLPWFDARDYNQGAFNDSTINLAIAAIGSFKATLLLATGTWTISDNLQIPSHITLMLVGGAELHIANGKQFQSTAHWSPPNPRSLRALARLCWAIVSMKFTPSGGPLKWSRSMTVAVPPFANVTTCRRQLIRARR